MKAEIERMKREKNAVILGHYYQRDEIQEVSDIVGDSLALAKEAQRSKHDIIVFCGVHFMAETAKILNPRRKVLVPEIGASCSLAESCEGRAFAEFRKQHPDHYVVSYINCTAAIKKQSDLICTSGNAVKLIEMLPKEQKIIFAPDRNLGAYINRVTGRDMLLWEGSCRVHDALRAERIEELKDRYREAAVIAHPECRGEVLEKADFVGSTKAMLGYIERSANRQYIVATEVGILYEMRKLYPEKQFIEVSCREGGEALRCEDMKMNTLELLYRCLKDESPEIVMSEEDIEMARRPIEKMIEMSKM